jgi:Uma2 family endonuclease
MATVTPDFAEPRQRPFTRAEYDRMGELGWFHGQRTELIEGEVVVLSPQKWPHASTTDRVAEVLRKAFGPGFWVRAQLPVNLGTFSEPEPDVSVVAGAREDYTDHPTSAVLLVEVSDATLWYDRNRKASLCARAGIADYWIVNLVDGQLEVRRNPVPDGTQFYSFSYASLSDLGPAESIIPLARPQVSIPVADLLP